MEYSSTWAGKGALIPETRVVLRELDAGRDGDEVRRAVIEHDLLDQRTRHSRSTMWKEIYRRYISQRDPDHVATLARMVAKCPNVTAVDLVLLYEYCQVDALLYDLTASCTYELYQNARSTIDRVDVNEWLSEQETDHQEITTWSPKTRNRLTSGYLATIRDFGLVTGANQKTFHKVYVPREAFVYALYHQNDRGIEGKALIHSEDWRLFLLSEGEVVLLLEDAARGGFVNFRYTADIYDLQFVFNDLEEAVGAIVGR